MSAARYRQALRVLERWPADPSKGEHRDIGVLLRKRIGASFKKGEQTEISEPEKCDKMLASLENISLDKYKQQHQLSPPLSVGSLLHDFEVCHISVSEEGLQHFKGKDKQGQGVFKTLYNKVVGSKTTEGENSDSMTVESGEKKMAT